jgi:hypothetical protein
MMHMVDLDTVHGVQWPPLLQAIMDLPKVQITGIGTDHDLLHQSRTAFTVGLEGVETANEEVVVGGDGGGIPPP